ncbi:hypothetical protein [Streptomyces sp. RPT161]|uniref:hypothetical protein n=1 Tax=Streptomyces sp. RPT161 TaxID=3015993 RepID=UPI0022B8CFC2|nr:hypothetical protein [Streptomyces sp. RPT161]
MPRGRHRHSPPLHRLLPSLTVAGSATALAVGAWFSPSGEHAVVLRALVTAAAAAACAGAVLLRSWDRAAGKRVAELTAARVRDEWRTDERIAELETDVEESREIRRRLESALRAKRGELSRLRGEHADLLRRYATAESERARALESRRRLAIEAAVPRGAIASATPSGGSSVSPAAYLKAANALRNFERNAARQRAAEAAEAEDRAPAVPPRATTAEDHAPLPEQPRLVPASAAVLPYAQARGTAAKRPQGGFDFFGVHKTSAAPDLADVIGDEAYAEHRAGQDHDDDPAVIDLTAHDETEQIDVRALRAQ